jgi:uroporphyrin-III C-methyltransferase / precorrin-2 dehydrogenase / sirohydrochlorin ferrochelatase
LLLAAGYHVRVDLPAQAPGVIVADALGPDPRLAGVLADRLAQAGYDGRAPVTLAAAGSADERAGGDVDLARQQLADRLGAAVSVAFVAAGSPRLAETSPQVVATYLLAPGNFNDDVQACGAEIIAAPIGAHPLLARIVLDRYLSGRGDNAAAARS